jgi:hypothetical protein
MLDLIDSVDLLMRSPSSTGALPGEHRFGHANPTPAWLQARVSNLQRFLHSGCEVCTASLGVVLMVGVEGGRRLAS